MYPSLKPFYGRTFDALKRLSRTLLHSLVFGCRGVTPARISYLPGSTLFSCVATVTGFEGVPNTNEFTLLCPECLSAVLSVGLKPRNISKKHSGPFEGFYDSFCWSFQSFLVQSFLWSPFRARGHSPSRSRPSASYINRGNLISCDQTNVFVVIPSSSVGEYVGSKKLFITWSRVRISEVDYLFVPVL